MNSLTMVPVIMRNNPSGSDASSLSTEIEELRMKELSRETRGQTGFNAKRTTLSIYYWLLVAVLMVVTVSALIQPLNANPTCILNCAQCVKIYGEFFDGHSCAKVCMESRTKFESFVDCADPTTIARFLKSY